MLSLRLRFGLSNQCMRCRFRNSPKARNGSTKLNLTDTAVWLPEMQAGSLFGRGEKTSLPFSSHALPTPVNDSLQHDRPDLSLWNSRSVSRQTLAFSSERRQLTISSLKASDSVLDQRMK